MCLQMSSLGLEIVLSRSGSPVVVCGSLLPGQSRHPALLGFHHLPFLAGRFRALAPAPCCSDCSVWMMLACLLRHRSSAWLGPM